MERQTRWENLVSLSHHLLKYFRMSGRGLKEEKYKGESFCETQQVYSYNK